MRKLNNKKITLLLAIFLLFVVSTFVAVLTMEKPEVQPGVGGGPGTINQLEQWKSDGTNITQSVANKPIKITGLSTGDCLTLNGSSVLTTTTCGAGGSSTTTINGVSGPAFTFASGTATGIGLIISTSTGTLTFTPTVSSGYVIPLSASTTNWETAYGWGDHSLAGYLTGVAWGDITGTLSNQTDLQTALNAKQDTLTTGNLTESITGLEFDATRQVIGGAAALSLTTGYTIPLTASTTEWHNKVSSQWGTSGSNIYYSAGNVGIGTTTPTDLLSVVGNSSSPGGVSTNVQNINAAGDARFSLQNNSTGKITVQATGGTYAIPNVGNISTQGNLTSLGFMTNGDVSSGGSAYITFSTGGWATSNERMRITSTGNVGIGTTSPSARLHVYGTSGTIRSDSAASVNVATDVLIANNISDSYRDYGAKLQVQRDGSLGQGWNFIVTNTVGTIAEAMRITPSGNVGIGTSSPSHLFTVAGDTNQTGALRFNGNAGTTGQILLSNGSSAPTWTATSSLGLGASFFQQNGNSFGTTATLGTNDAQNLAFETSGTTRVTIDTAGNVGIGTTNQTSYDVAANNLVVYEAGDGGITVAGGTTNKGSLTFADGISGSAYRGGIQYNHSTDKLQLWSNGLITSTPEVTLSNGNVGIGTTTPSSKLTVQGDAWFGGSVTATGTLAVTGSTTISSLATANCDVFATALGSLYCGTNGAGGGTVTSVDMSVPTGLSISGNPITTSGTLALTLTSGYVIPLSASTTEWTNFYNTPSTRITDGTGLTWSGNTLNVDDAYVLNTGDSISGNLTFSGTGANIALGSNYLSGDGGDEGIYVDSSGNVGIGTTTIGARLSLQTTGTTDILNLFETGGTEVFSVLESGNIGIGTSTPAAKLDITGTSGTGNIFTVSSSTNSRLLTLNALGYLGIGSSTPSAPLVVDDGVNATSTVQIGGPGSVGCLAIRDTDDAGYTYVTALNGVLSASMTSCE